MKRILIIGLSIGIAVFPGLAMAWQAWNRHEVNQLSNGVFEVVGRPGSGAADYWCAAGDYTYRNLRSASVQRVYIYRGVGPSVSRPGYKAIQFALTPPAGANTEPSVTLSMHRVGDNMRAAAAQQYCFDSDPFYPVSLRP